MISGLAGLFLSRPLSESDLPSFCFWLSLLTWLKFCAECDWDSLDVGKLNQCYEAILFYSSPLFLSVLRVLD